MTVKEQMYVNVIAIQPWTCLHQIWMHQMFASDNQQENYSHNHFSLTDSRSARSI